MSGNVQMELYLHKYKLEALSSVLAEQGSSVEQRIEDMLYDLYSELVPVEEQEKIQARIDAELAEREASRQYTAFRVRQNGKDEFFQLDHCEEFIDIAVFLRGCFYRQRAPSATVLEETFPGLEPISAEQYNQMITLRMEDSQRITGVFDLDFNKWETSMIDDAQSWQTYSMKDVTTAVTRAYSKHGLRLFNYKIRLENNLNGKRIPSAGHLSRQDISFAEEISEVGNLLNFYMETNFDVDAVFGTHVRTSENDDWVNVYVNYDMAAGQVCDALEVDLHRADGRKETLEYQLDAAEKAVLLRKMDAYCQMQTGQPLAKYSAQLMAEEMAPPTGPVM